jgi:Right handed beta helix region
MTKAFFIPLGLFLIAVVSTRSEVAHTFSVAPPPLGDDTNTGTTAAPFATLDRARLAVRAYRENRAGRKHGDVVVEVRGGIYELAAPVRFDAADSGEKDTSIVYRAAIGETPVLSGGRQVSGWMREAEGVYRAEVGSEVDFRQLWVNDRRAVRARLPNAGRTFRFEREKQADGFDIPRTELGTLNLRPGETEFSVPIAWMHKRLRIARLVDTGDPALVRAVIEPGEWDGVINQPQGDRVYLGREYWLENAHEFLDAPGEFFLDRTGGVLRYRLRPDEDLATVAVVRPELENLIVLAGRLDAPVHHLRFEGLTFAHTGWTRPNHHGFVDVQANSLVPASPAAAVDAQYRHNQRKDRIPAAFEATTSDDIIVQGCRFVRLGGAGLVFTHGGNDNVIEGNTFFDLSAGGIEFGEDAVRPADQRLFPRGNRIANNFIAHVGEEYFGSVAILGYYTDGSFITHNEILGVPYTAISQGWGWGNPISPPDSRANRITHNRISNFMRRLDDGGGIYTTDPQAGSEIAYNLIERMAPPDALTKAGGALYLDQFTSGYHVHHNIVTEAVRWLNIWNPNIRGNRVDGNFADTTAQRNDGTDNFVEPVKLLASRPWPEGATAIRKSAGIEPRFASARSVPISPEVIVESASVDFQIVSGTWSVSDSARGIYGASCRQSSKVGATARWMPILPGDGQYEVSAWRAANSAAAVYTIHYADGETVVPLSAAPGESGWISLGVFRQKMGFGSEVVVSSTKETQASPLVADAVRWRRMK